MTDYRKQLLLSGMAYAMVLRRLVHTGGLVILIVGLAAASGIACGNASAPEDAVSIPGNFSSSGPTDSYGADDRVRPYTQNPSYWQYNGRPVLLLGGSKDDNLFQIPDLREHLDDVIAAGGNYVRNTMSSRDPGNMWPFHRRADGRYDLEHLNESYFERFENLLDLALERDVIVQIELWDRFDFAREPWMENPYRPENNVNYSPGESGLGNEYLLHPNENENPFFRSVPENDDNRTVLHYQQAQVDRLLDISLEYPNVLYTIDNETSSTPQWGAYWADYIRRRAAEREVHVYTTEMWDDWDIRSEQHRHTLDHPERYGFADISQNNHNSGDRHWDNLQWVRRFTADRTRPLNNVKIYGADGGRFGTSRDGLERFWRSILGGAASARFHRPESGLGLSNEAQSSMRSARLLTEAFDIHLAVPDAEGTLLANRQENEAFLSHIPGEKYAVYFPDSGAVTLDMREHPGTYEVRWLDVAASEWHHTSEVEPLTGVELRAPKAGHWVVLLTKVP